MVEASTRRIRPRHFVLVRCPVETYIISYRNPMSDRVHAHLQQKRKKILKQSSV